METTRLEAFSDGVIAVIITMHGARDESAARPELAALAPVLPVFLSYVLSFVYVGIYWNNHHHMFQLAESRRRRRAVGQPAPAVLAVAAAVLDRLDGREPLRALADRVSTAPTPAASRDRVLRSCRQSIIRRDGRTGLLAQAVARRLQGARSRRVSTSPASPASWFLPAWTGHGLLRRRRDHLVSFPTAAWNE